VSPPSPSQVPKPPAPASAKTQAHSSYPRGRPNWAPPRRVNGYGALPSQAIEREEKMQVSLERLRQRGDDGAREGGFTLIELLIVIVILGILAAIVVFAVQNLSKSSATASCGTDYKTAETSVEAYKAQMGQYPSGNLTGFQSSITPFTDNLSGVSQTGAVGASPNGANAAAAGGPLLTVGGTSPNIVGAGTIGPWLKDVPTDPSHYTLWVSNDGSGTITVLGPSNLVIGTRATSCSSVS